MNLTYQRIRIAFGRLRSCLKRLKDKPDVLEKYSGAIEQRHCGKGTRPCV